MQAEGTAWTVWDGAVVLAKYLDKATSGGLRNWPDFLVKNMHCVELGAGTGLAGIAASRCLWVRGRAARCDCRSQLVQHSMTLLGVAQKRCGRNTASANVPST